MEADSFAPDSILRSGCCMYRYMRLAVERNPDHSLDHSYLGRTVGILHTAAVGCSIGCIVVGYDRIVGTVVLVEMVVLEAGKYLLLQGNYALVRPGFSDSEGSDFVGPDEIIPCHLGLRDHPPMNQDRTYSPPWNGEVNARVSITVLCFRAAIRVLGWLAARVGS